MLTAMAGARFIGVTNDYRSMFDRDNPQIALLDAFESVYWTSNTALIAIAPDSGTVFTHASLRAMEDLTEASWQVPYSTRIDSLTNYAHSSAEGDELIVAPLVEDALSLEQADLAEIERIATTDNDIAGRLVSLDGTVAGLTISFTLPENSDAAVAEITDFIGDMLNQHRTENPSIGYYVTGDIPLNRTFADATDRDLRTLAPLVLLVITVVAFILLRSALATAALLAVVIFSVNTVMGSAGWLRTVFNPANAGVPVIVMTMAIAHSVHIVDSFLTALKRGLSREQAVIDSLNTNAWPVFLTTATTIIGFLSLNGSDSPPFRVLGNLVALGVFCAFLFSATLLPALLAILPIKPRKARNGQSTVFDRLGAFVVARRRLLLLGSSFTAIVLSAGIFLLDLTDNWWTYFDERYQFRRDTDFVVENLTGIQTLEYSLESGREGGIADPVFLQRVDRIAEWFRDQPEVLHVQVLTDVMKRLNMNLHGDAADQFRLPDDPELAAQYLLLYELSLPFGQDLNNRINVGKSATRMTVTLHSLTAGEQRALDARAQAWVAENSPGLTRDASGISIAFAHLAQRNIKSMFTSTVTAMALISLILVVVFRSVRLGAISLIPNFIPAALSLGLWGYLVGKVGLAGSVMTAFAFGIIVDDTIHFLSHYLKARREGCTAENAVCRTFNSVGHALWTNSAVLAAGFLVFATSGFEVSWTLGMLVALTIGFALSADFLLLPPLLIALDRRNKL